MPTDVAPFRGHTTSLALDDVLALWAACDDDRLGPAFRLMITTTMRPGEALGLCWDSINLETGELTLHRAIRRTAGKPILVDGRHGLKTRNAERKFIVPAPTLAALAAHKAKVAARRLAASEWEEMPGGGLVFPTVHGGPWEAACVRRELARVCERAGIDTVSPGALRHTAKGLLDDDRTDPVVIRNLMGHSNEWMQDSYSQRGRRAEDGHVATMERLFGGAS